jgi:hypothetical protein
MKDDDEMIVRQDRSQTSMQRRGTAGVILTALLGLLSFVAKGALVFGLVVAVLCIGAALLLYVRGSRRRIEVDVESVTVQNLRRTHAVARADVADIAFHEKGSLYKAQVRRKDGSTVDIEILAGVMGSARHRKDQQTVDELNRYLKARRRSR